MTLSPSGPLKFGFQNVLPPADDGGAFRLADFETTQRLVLALERNGFHAMWVGDHLAFAQPILDPLIQLSQASAISQRLMLGTAVFLLPLRHPAPVAKQVATLDLLSSGRVIFGVGVGGEFPGEFALSGVPVKERGARLSEGIEVLRKLWRGEPVAHSGKFYPFPETLMLPAPHQSGGPPIWCGGRKEAALRRAGRLADGWLSYVVTPDQYRAALEIIARAGEEAERDLSGFATGHLLFVRLAKDYDSALQYATEKLSKRYAMDFSKPAKRYCALGTAQQVAASIREFHQAGVRHLVLDFIAERDDQIEQIDHFGEAVMPLLTDLT
ncbi:MAG: LLM class flavin-dependent oxidoreductase [Rhodospirillaceae bacterium]|nr:LLM class flavin-dependent oxidoreductase [Rhodospirillaceae bacterium]